jgi:hypothetical protein
MDKKDAGTYSYTAEKASGVKFKDKNDVIPGKKKVLYLKIPEGIHTFTFLLSEPAGSNSYARFYVKTKSKKIVMTSMTPQSYSQVTTEILGDQEIIYYVATYTQPIRMRIFGPTKVQVINRLDYDITMKGKQNYSITVLENGKQVSIEKFSTSKSSLGYYRDRTQIVPGDDKKFFLSVPEGEHIYDFQLSGTSAKSAALRFMIPEDDLDIGEE